MTIAGPDEGVLDPWVANWLDANPRLFELPDIYTMARGTESPFPVTRDVKSTRDDAVDGIPIRIYEPIDTPTGLFVYFHGGGMCVGSIALMDNVARELVHATGATLISVEYRLAPEHPFPAGIDDCEMVTRWMQANADEFGFDRAHVMIGGESAGGTMTAAVTLRLRASNDCDLAGQVLIYPGVDSGASTMPSRSAFAGYMMSKREMEWCWESYSAGRDIANDPFAAPLRAPSLAGLPPAIVILGGCDFLRDEGRAYAARLRDESVDAIDICYPGQIHGFMNHMFPAAADAYGEIGVWARARFAAVSSTR